MSDWLDGLFGIVLAVLGGWGGALPETVSPETAPPPTRTTHVVAHVIDGDTLVLENGERVRLLGIDTPEEGECYYQESTRFLRHWLDGATISLEGDVRDRDDYNRLLRYVFTTMTPDGVATTTQQLVNDALIKRGYATVLPIGDDRRYRAQFRASYDAAQAAERGRWQVCAT